ncbi:MAG: hypothetical protein ACE5Z5_14240, partial [Candidatus Bathyarchaeia archaeon]
SWERKRTSIPGINVIKMPPYGRRGARLAVEINPVDESGKAMKRRGLIITSKEDLETYRGLLLNEKLAELLEKIDQLTAPEEKPGEDVIEL